MLTQGQAIASIAVMAVVTFLTRALPFLLFDRGESPPKLVIYLGRVLPPAVIAMLIVYCLRSPSVAVDPALTENLAGWLTSVVSFFVAVEPALTESLARWLAPVVSFFVGWGPQLIAGVVVVVLHAWKHNNLLSIFGGTVLYMVLIQVVFV